MSRRRLYIFSLWLATCSVLLSTVVLHHHHSHSICFIEERCQKDGNLNDEHTEHHENEQEGCNIQQSHHFLVNSKWVKNVHQSLLEGSLVFISILPPSYLYFPSLSLVITQWQERILPLNDGKQLLPDRRGSPAIS